MERRWFFFGILSYLFLGFIAFPFFIGIPVFTAFGSDAISYSTAATHLLKQGFYSLDGIQPFLEREPGMSFFLLPLYFLFGIENPIALYLVQGALLLTASWMFCRELARTAGARAAGICFILLLTSGSLFHAVFLAYRENLTLCCLLFFSALYLSAGKRPTNGKSVLMGLLLGFTILTYYSFIFLPPALLAVWLMQRRPLKELGIIVLVCYALVSVWAFRNASYDGRFRVIDSHRTGVMWYVRGEQAEKLHGLEPLLCLWSEYVSRDWVGRSPACSFNALMHVRWPPGYFPPSDYAAAATEGQAKIFAHFGSYLWFSFFEILELHIPYLGGGISHAFNLFIVLTAFILYAGFFFGLKKAFNREHALWLLLIAYNTGIFILTDATPRYLVPVLFCYAVIAAIGYDALFTTLSKRQK